MPWWLIPSIIIVVVAGAGAGLLMGRFILKRQKKSLPVSENNHSESLHVGKKPAPTPKLAASGKPRLITKIESRKEKTVETQAQSITLAEDTLEKYIAKSQSSQLNITPAVPENNFQATTSSVVPEKSLQAKMPQIVPEKNFQAPSYSVIPEKSSPPPKPPAIRYQSAAILELESNLAIAKLPMSEKLASFKTDVWNTQRSEFNLTSSQLLSELTEAYVDMLLANNIVWLVTELGRDSKDLRESYSDLKKKVTERLERILPQVKESKK
jgi:hypothetical protein